ncbi:MAG: hypothetical protein J5614_01015 [Paludibacteraceae bacterium]|nr:hypothetical protein [Paludibacteraceae bacterium]
MSSYLIPGFSELVADNSIEQGNPLLYSYSPRLFGSPPQLTTLNDIRSMSDESGGIDGPVGDFYLRHVLRDAQVVNFCVGHAMFTGGMSSLFNGIRVVIQYLIASSKYESSTVGTNGNAATEARTSQLMKAYEEALTNDDGKYETAKASETAGLTDDLDPDALVLTNSSLGEYTSMVGGISAALLTSLSVQQPFYTFESDWNTYINNVSMMCNAAAVMLGITNSSVRIGDRFEAINQKDIWNKYKWITVDSSMANGKAEQNGETNNYVTFMTDPKSVSESYTNSTTPSQIYSSVINAGDAIGKEIAFITSSSQNQVDDLVVNIAGDAINAAEKVMTALTGGIGRFTAAVASSMSRSFIGQHTIYPEIFSEHTSNGSELSFTVKLRASGGDPYSYFTEILVPMFFALGLVLPQMSKNSAAAYTYPPLVQCNVPGLWGTRLGIVTSLSITKNVDGNDISIYGYPMSVDLQISVKDLMHVMVTTPMDKPALLLNNHTMFDYIAQCCGVDKYKPNAAMRLMTKKILASNAASNLFSNIGDAITSDFYRVANRFLGTEMF